jgi:hypothetical protein
MGKRGPPARVVPDWIWEYVELHTVGQSQPVKIALINKLLIQNGEVPIKRSFYQDHVARRKAARCLALVAGEPSPSVAAPATPVSARQRTRVRPLRRGHRMRIRRTLMMGPPVHGINSTCRRDPVRRL